MATAVTLFDRAPWLLPAGGLRVQYHLVRRPQPNGYSGL
jgi:hypothetical protein